MNLTHSKTMKNTNNLNKRFLLTLDIDWCPDYMLDWVVELLISLEVPAVFFVTHNTPILQKIRLNSLFALGIHPNFNPGSTHGKTIEEIYQHVLEIVPEARVARSHSLNISSLHLDYLMRETNIVVENSLLFPLYKNADFCTYEQAGNKIYRVPYIFDDYYALNSKKAFSFFTSEAEELQGELNIINFHPVHLYMNTTSISNYALQKQHIFCDRNKVPLNSAPIQFGARKMFCDLLKVIHTKNWILEHPDYLLTYTG